MTSVAIDTLKLARRLEAAGFGRDQAAGAAEALGEAIAEAVVTRDYLDRRLGESDAKVEQRLGATDAKLDQRGTETDSRLDRRLGETDARIAAVEANLRIHIADVRTEVLKWMVGLLLGQTAMLAALVRLL